MFPENKGCWYVDLPLGSIISHRDEQLIIVVILVSDDDTHGPRVLGPDHLGDEGTVASLYQSQLPLQLVRVGDEATTTGRLRGDEVDTSLAHIPAGGKYSGVGLQ